MISFNFSIDKKESFAYWLQGLVEWSPSFQKDANKYYLAKAGNLSEQEIGALKDLKNFLEDKSRGYLWLWDIYTGKKINNADDIKRWESIENVFSSKFDLVWEEEESNLIKWKSILENHKFSEIEKELEKLKSFFGIKGASNEIYEVRLFVHWNKNLPSGHTHKNYKNFIILPISSVQPEEISRVFGVIIHEATHYLGYESSTFEKDLVGAYDKYIKPTGLKIGNQSWKSLLSETVITSIIGKRFNNYLGKKLNKTDKEQIAADQDSAELDNFIFSNHKTNSGFLIRKAASLLLPLTTKYLDSGMMMDADYAKKVATVWLEMCEVKTGFWHGLIDKFKI